MPQTIFARPASADHAPYYSAYTSGVPAGDILEIASAQIHELRSLLGHLTDEQSRFRYAQGKWSIREVIGHLTDTERVFSYRAMAFSRADAGALPGFDQVAWTPFGEYHERSLPDLLDEWETVRRASLALMRGLPPAALERRGIASNVEFTVLAALVIFVGHVSYHLELLKRDYVNALG